MKSNRAGVVLDKKMLGKIVRGVLELVAMKQRRDGQTGVHTVRNPAAYKFRS